MPKLNTKNIERKICEAALKAAATHGWPNLTHDIIAKSAKLLVGQIRKAFPEINDLLPAIVGHIDGEVASALGKSFRGTPHDRLFEIMMARFDILQSHRTSIIAIMNATKQNPVLMKHIFPAQVKSMQRALVLARLNESGAREALSVAGLLAIYGAVLCTWQSDDTKDMSRTMAALDRYLRHAGKLADILLRAF